MGTGRKRGWGKERGWLAQMGMVHAGAAARRGAAPGFLCWCSLPPLLASSPIVLSNFQGVDVRDDVLVREQGKGNRPLA